MVDYDHLPNFNVRAICIKTNLALQKVYEYLVVMQTLVQPCILNKRFYQSQGHNKINSAFIALWITPFLFGTKCDSCIISKKSIAFRTLVEIDDTI